MASAEEIESAKANAIAAEKIATERAAAEKAEAARIAKADAEYKASDEYQMWLAAQPKEG